MLVTPSGIVTLVRLLHPENAEFARLVTLSATTTFVIEVYASGNTADIFIEQTLWGIVTLVRLLQPRNA